MKEQILKILEKYKQDLSTDYWSDQNYGVSEDNLEEVADEILELLKSQEIIK